jgi:hypothetical protein
MLLANAEEGMLAESAAAIFAPRKKICPPEPSGAAMISSHLASSRHFAALASVCDREPGVFGIAGARP